MFTATMSGGIIADGDKCETCVFFRMIHLNHRLGDCRNDPENVTDTTADGWCVNHEKE